MSLSPSSLRDRVLAFRAAEAPRLRRLGDYYRGRHAVLSAPPPASGADNRLVNPFCRSITDCTVGYFMGRGVRYETPDPAAAEMIRRVGLRNDERFVNGALARDVSVYGRAAELLWYDDVSDVRFTPLDPETVFPVRANTPDTPLTAAVRLWTDADGSEMADVCDDAEIATYRFRAGEPSRVRVRRHYFGAVPVVFYENNRDGIGDFEPVLSLVDAYDKLQSASVNDFELFADAYLAISGMGGTTAEDVERIRRDRVILLDDGGKADWLTKNVNDGAAENLKARIARDVYRFSNTVDIAEEVRSGAALSGTAIRYRFLNFENRVAVTEQYFRRSLHERWRLVCRLLNLTGCAYDPEEITVRFERNMPIEE